MININKKRVKALQLIKLPNGIGFKGDVHLKNQFKLIGKNGNIYTFKYKDREYDIKPAQWFVFERELVVVDDKEFESYYNIENKAFNKVLIEMIWYFVIVLSALGFLGTILFMLSFITNIF